MIQYDLEKANAKLAETANVLMPGDIIISRPPQHNTAFALRQTKVDRAPEWICERYLRVNAEAEALRLAGMMGVKVWIETNGGKLVQVKP